MTAEPHILVFDSGAGGLSVARAILKHSFNCKLSYIADTAGFPYGIMGDSELIARVCEQVGKFIDSLQPDIAVIACNTASTVALDALRAQFQVPFVGVVPAIKPAAERSKTGVIGILATPATVNRDYTFSLISNFANTQKVLLHGSNNLVLMAEDAVFNRPPDRMALQRELDGLFLQEDGDKIDTVVLACTHFPLLAAYFPKSRADHPIEWIDSSLAIARRVDYWINQLGFPAQLRADEPFQISVTVTSANDAALQSAYQRYMSV